MAVLSDTTRAAVAYKKLIGLANTADDANFFNESIPSQISIGSNEVFGEPIPSTVSTATSANIAVQVELELEPNTSRNTGIAYDLVIPNGFTYTDSNGTSQTVTGTTEQRKVRNASPAVQIIPKKFNVAPATLNGYGYDLYKDSTNTPLNPSNSGNRVPPTSDFAWQVDPVAGTLTSQIPLDGELTANATLVCYLYTGEFLDEVINGLPVGGGGGGSAGIVANTQFGIEAIFDASTGETELKTRLDQVIVAGTGLLEENYDSGSRDITLGVDTTYFDNNYIKEDGDDVTLSSGNFYNFGSGLFRIDKSGTNGYLSTNADNIKISQNGDVQILDNGTNNGNLDVAGDATVNGSCTADSFTELSSERFKTNISSLSNQIDVMDALRPVTYTSKSTGNHEYGLIAEEVAEIYPELVDFDDQGKPKSIRYSRMVSVLIQSVKDLRDEVEMLKS